MGLAQLRQQALTHTEVEALIECGVGLVEPQILAAFDIMPISVRFRAASRTVRA
jgi:hypothetical protein